MGQSVESQGKGGQNVEAALAYKIQVLIKCKEGYTAQPLCWAGWAGGTAAHYDQSVLGHSHGACPRGTEQEGVRRSTIVTARCRCCGCCC